MPMYTPLTIANFFIKNYGKAHPLDHLKLQKLVYCAHGWWLASAQEKERLVSERPQVWRYGPVFASLYHTLKVFGLTPIRAPQAPAPFSAPPAIDRKDEKSLQLLKWVWQRYGGLSALTLSDMTHKEGSPWHQCAREHDFSVPKGLEIPDAYIRAEFAAIASGA